MNREIIFRAKRVDTKEWVEGDLIQLNSRVVIADKRMAAYDKGNIHETISIECVEVIPETIGQFTGLTDKNGKRIFEGDVLNVIGVEAFYTYVISYENGCFIATHTKIKAHDYKPLKWGNVNRFNELSIEIEVIGNIHDK